MKANDLMVGDYVSVKPSGMPIKVAAVHHKKVAYHAVVNKLAWVRESLLEPIPLTSDILEKNGFHEEWDEDIKLMVCDTITIEIGNNYKLYKDGKMYLRRVLAPLYYVHQLQHALRLCGVEKTIGL